MSSARTAARGCAILSEASSSPTLAPMHDELLKQFPQAKWHVYEPVVTAKCAVRCLT